MSNSWIPQRGQVVLVRFPFLPAGGVPQAQVRPAVVVSGPAIHDHTADVLIVAISSRPISHALPTDYELVLGTPAATAAGLRQTSWVKVSNVAAVPKAAVIRRLGQLPPSAIQAIDERLRMAFDLSFSSR
jgi:mRNA-degrading endonuclease toxin of MazEF toxin-antitoxin module